jgi:hypothetical protein
LDCGHAFGQLTRYRLFSSEKGDPQARLHAAIGWPKEQVKRL